MSYLTATALGRLREGSFEQRAVMVKAAVEEKLGQGVSVLATTSGSMTVLAEDGTFYRALYGWNDKNLLIGDVEVEKADVPVVEDLDVYLAGELRDMTRALMRGGLDEESRNRFRELACHVRDDGDYWLSTVSARIEEACREDGWFQTYTESMDEIRGAMKGQIRALEGQVPRTRYVRLGAEKLGRYEAALRESVSTLRKILRHTVDSCRDFVFSSDEDMDLSEVRDSLIEEARAVAGMLAKVERLVTRHDLYEMALVHDRVAERSKDMMIVAGYLGRNQP